MYTLNWLMTYGKNDEFYLVVDCIDTFDTIEQAAQFADDGSLTYYTIEEV